MSKLENKYINIVSDDIKSVVRALNRNQLSGIAEVVKVYEQKLCEYFNVSYAHACNSGTAGIELILRAIQVKQGDEVLLPPTAPVMCILPIMALGATPIFVDIDSDSTFGVNIDDLQKKITLKTKALLVVPMWGYPIQMNKIKNICKKKELVLIEDVSHCHGSMIENNYLGTLADISIFSTQERKLVTTGEGGFILTNSPELSQSVQEMRNFGRATTNVAYFDKKIDNFGLRFGLNYRISATNAALGISQLAKLKEKIKTRTKNAQYIKKQLSNVNWLEEITVLKNSTPNYYSIVFKIKDRTISNVKLGEYLEKNDVISDTYRYNYQPLYKMPLFKKYKNHCPNAEELTKSIFTLPTHEGLIMKDLKRIINLVVNYHASYN